jgi:hypothetical protein
LGFLILGVVVWAVVGGGVGAAIGNSKGRGPTGFWLGFFFGGIGWIIVAVMQATPEAEVARMAAINTLQGNVKSAYTSGSTSTRACPYCAETIKSAAVVCRFCGNAVEPMTSAVFKDQRPQEVTAATFKYDSNVVLPPLRTCEGCGSEFTPVYRSSACPDCGGELRPING